jgi:hypothetical protein
MLLQSQFNTSGGGALAIVPGYTPKASGGLETVDSSFFAAKVVAFVGNAATEASKYWQTEGEFRGLR